MELLPVPSATHLALFVKPDSVLVLAAAAVATVQPASLYC